MISLTIITIIAHIVTSCQAMHGPSSAESQSSSTHNPMARYIELHRQIYDSNLQQAISGPELQAILVEMSSIEQNIGPELVNESSEINTNLYKSLLDESRRRNLLADQDTTITDVLLQTFDHESNSCNEDYFKLLKNIDEIFGTNLATIKRVLIENRELQYKDCWNRLMETLFSSCLLLGRRNLEPLDKLSTYINGNSEGIIMPPGRNDSSVSHNEIIRISEGIANFLKDINTAKRVADVKKSFKLLVVQPCRLLIERTRLIMNDIYAMLNFTGLNREFIKTDDEIILNRYVMCERIMSNLVYVGHKVIQFTSHVNPSGSSNFENSANLITQHMPSNPPMPIQQIIKTELLETDPDIDSDSESDSEYKPEDESEPDPKRTKIALVQSERVGSQQLSSQPKKVVRVIMAEGHGKSTRYLTEWSDGSRTKETKDYLMRNWYQAWDKHFRQRKSFNYANFRARRKSAQSMDARPERPNLITQSTIMQPPIRILESNSLSERDLNPYQNQNPIQRPNRRIRRVLKIEKAVEHEGEIKYSTQWSDGTTTFEEQLYLVNNYIDEWLEYVRRLNRESVKQAKIMAKNFGPY